MGGGRLQQSFPPPLVGPIPGNGFMQPLLKGVGGLPAQFTPQASGIQRVSSIMTKPVGDVINVGNVPVQAGKDSANHLQVRELTITGNQVGGSHLAAMSNRIDGGTVIADINPVSDVFAIPVERDSAPSKNASDDERDELLWMLVWSKIVPAIRDRRL